MEYHTSWTNNYGTWITNCDTKLLNLNSYIHIFKITIEYKLLLSKVVTIYFIFT